MTPGEFAKCCADEKATMLATYLQRRGNTAVGALIETLKLNESQRAILAQIIDGILTECFYTFLLALDGAASLGGKQVRYVLRDEDGNELTNGLLEGAAWTALQNSKTPAAG